MCIRDSIDVDPAEISKNVKVHIPIVGDARQILKSLNKYIQRCNSGAWIEKINQWKKEYPLAYRQSSPDVIMPQFVIEQISEACKDAIIATEVGHTRCGQLSSTNIRSRALSLHQAGLVQWAM